MDAHPVAEVRGVLGRAERVDEALERGDRGVDLEDARRHGLRRAGAGYARPRGAPAVPPAAAERRPADVARLQVLEAHPLLLLPLPLSAWLPPARSNRRPPPLESRLPPPSRRWDPRGLSAARGANWDLGSLESGDRVASPFGLLSLLSCVSFRVASD